MQKHLHSYLPKTCICNYRLQYSILNYYSIPDLNIQVMKSRILEFFWILLLTAGVAS